jgi:hypothetical protein
MKPRPVSASEIEEAARAGVGITRCPTVSVAPSGVGVSEGDRRALVAHDLELQEKRAQLWNFRQSGKKRPAVIGEKNLTVSGRDR